MALRLKNAPAVLSVAVLLVTCGQLSANERALVGQFTIDRTEVTIGQFTGFAEATGLMTAAEPWVADTSGARDGSGVLDGTYRTPFGEAPQSTSEPAVHVSWHEAAAYCAWAGGRLPTIEEWVQAAYRETRPDPSAGFIAGRQYAYPVGDTPIGANTRGDDPWPRHAAAGTTQVGVNGLYDMGGNVWEWLADRDGQAALTAGGSWWYGAEEMVSSAMQWKPVDFYVVYIGFRCVYDHGRADKS
ncbi:formylglycine-generating enzyme family protein [Mesorhizobium sp.]|uniref:formylglycine-generating enzyme family protein n=1 Tax=Mesorhizobium sp. TaxID=1871066 RepID=UPI0025809E1B|nr:formylglycine-generating enzyme family protein [Mesorhizobium sp.]